MTKPLHFGLLLFPDVMQLDMTGPAEVFAAVPDACVHLIWKTLDPVKTSKGWKIIPTDTFETCPQLDVVCVPGGSGQIDLMEDEPTLEFLKTQAMQTRFVTSVCTGSLVLAAAGLLSGYKAACHWMSQDQLHLFGAIPTNERVVIDRNRITGGGVTAGIDFGLTVIAQLYGEEVAKTVQLSLEYNPKPPFNAGSVETAGPELVKNVTKAAEARQMRRYEVSKKAAQKVMHTMAAE